MTNHEFYEYYTWERHRLYVFWVHEAYWDIVVHALIRVGATFSWMPSSYDDKPYRFWIKESSASTWESDVDDKQWHIDYILSKPIYPYVHVTPDGELILINSVSPDGEYKIERC